MPRKANPVESIYEREEGSGLWYAWFKINGKLVRNFFGKNRAAAVNYAEKAQTLRRSGKGVVPSTVKRPVLTIPELNTLGGSVTVNELCDDHLPHIQRRLVPQLLKSLGQQNN